MSSALCVLKIPDFTIKSEDWKSFKGMLECRHCGQPAPETAIKIFGGCPNWDCKGFKMKPGSDPASKATRKEDD